MQSIGIAFLFLIFISFSTSVAICAWYHRRRRRVQRRTQEAGQVERAIQHSIHSLVMEERRAIREMLRASMQQSPTAASSMPLTIPKTPIMVRATYSQLKSMQETSSFQKKKEEFECAVRSCHVENSPPLILHLNRNEVWKNSLRLLKSSRQELLGPLFVHFEGEEGKDDGGLTRHWFMLIAREMTNNRLFSPCCAGSRTVHITPNSNPTAAQLDEYKFLGIVFAKALFDGFIIPVNISSTLCKRLMGRHVDISDLASEDPCFVKSVEWLRDNNIDDAGLSLYFVCDLEDDAIVPKPEEPSLLPNIEHTEIEIKAIEGNCDEETTKDNDNEDIILKKEDEDNDIDKNDDDDDEDDDDEEEIESNNLIPGHCLYDLIPGGRDIAVTEENKEKYLELLIEAKLLQGTVRQMEAFLSTFHTLIPADFLSSFEADEVRLLMCGLPDIDVNDWRRNTVYKAGYSDDSAIIKWFWEIVSSWDNELRAKLLEFVTGTCVVTAGGFQELFCSNGIRPFHIIQVTDISRLPQANTCFNELLLPPYSSREHLESQLTTSMFEGGERFHLR